MLLMATWLAALAAAPTEYQEHHCDNPMAQMDMNICASLDFQVADAELNTLWQHVIADAHEADTEIDRATDTRPTYEAVLRDAQRAWVQFRDAHCTWEGYEARGGSMEPMLEEGCRARLTRERIAQLRPPESEAR
jgi:uncharacterized protein YecT (DUF1311 family)